MSVVQKAEINVLPDRDQIIHENSEGRGRVIPERSKSGKGGVLEI